MCQPYIESTIIFSDYNDEESQELVVFVGLWKGTSNICTC